jgi:phospholipid/cholesterol/gamma-HCH transport system substrate-binding protein
LRHLQPTLTRLGDAGDSLANGLSMLASFPFPKEAGNIVKGDYANALFHMDINLNNIIKSPGSELPNILNLCTATPLDPACTALSPLLKASVCAVAPANVVAILCPPGSKASKKSPAPLSQLGTVPGLGTSSSSGSSGGSGGGLGSLLGLGGGGH